MNWETFHDGETFDFTVNGKTYTATIEHDENHGAPWDECDGHGEVTDWEWRDKLPGELVLSEDRHAKRFYDFAGAVKLARRDGWGFLPGDLETDEVMPGIWRARVAPNFRHGDYRFICIAGDINEAIRGTYASHRATFTTARAYHAAAARADYENLRAWCNNQWCYIGVVVRRKGDEMFCAETQSLWGIESNAGAYIRETAEELAEQFDDCETND